MRKSINHSAYLRSLRQFPVVGALARCQQALRSSAPQATADVEAELDELLRHFITKSTCPRCGAPLYLSDLPQYDFTCYECDENF